MKVMQVDAGAVVDVVNVNGKVGRGGNVCSCKACLFDLFHCVPSCFSVLIFHYPRPMISHQPDYYQQLVFPRRFGKE